MKSKPIYCGVPLFGIIVVYKIMRTETHSENVFVVGIETNELTENHQDST
jgi:hypothetical protein